MKTATKTHTLRVTLLLLALWPVAQHMLVRNLGATPWKLAGWGMYTTPQANVGVTVLVEGDALNTITVPAAAAMRVDVTVTHPAIADILLSGYRTRYP